MQFLSSVPRLYFLYDIPMIAFNTFLLPLKILYTKGTTPKKIPSKEIYLFSFLHFYSCSFKFMFLILCIINGCMYITILSVRGLFLLCFLWPFIFPLLFLYFYFCHYLTLLFHFSCFLVFNNFLLLSITHLNCIFPYLLIFFICLVPTFSLLLPHFHLPSSALRVSYQFFFLTGHTIVFWDLLVYRSLLTSSFILHKGPHRPFWVNSLLLQCPLWRLYQSLIPSDTRNMNVFQ